jgi:hypothetical protein
VRGMYRLAAYASRNGDGYQLLDDRVVPGHNVKWVLDAPAHAEVAGMIPQGGPAIAILVAGIFVAVIAAIVAMEKRRKPIPWAITGFVVTIIVVSAVDAML